MSRGTLLVVLAGSVWCCAGCGRQVPRTGPRTAVARFENLTPDRSLEWVGRGAAEILADQIGGAPGAQVLPVSDHNQAAALGAARFISGYYSVVKGSLRLDAWVQEGSSGKITRVAFAAAPLTGGLLAISDRVARQIEPAAQAFATRNEEALRAFLEGRQAREPSAAAQAYARAVSLDPGFGLAYLAWLQTALARQDYAEAQRVFDMARAAGNRVRAIDRARLDVEEAALRRDPAAQTNALRAMTRLRPADAALWRKLADAELAAHRISEAEQSYRKAAELEPDNPAVLNTLGYTAALAGNLGAAVSALERYQRLRPDDANPLDSLGDVYFRFGRLEEAEKYYRQAFEKSPTGAGGLSLEKAAQARLFSGDLAGADAVFNQFIQVRQRAGDPAAEYRRAQWLFLTGRKRSGIQTMESLARQHRLPQVVSQAEAQLAVWYLQTGDRSSARQSAEAAAAASPGPAGLVAVVRFLTEPPAPASEWAVRAERAFPQPAEERMKNFALGYALLLGRHFAAAAPLWRQIYRQSNPTSPEGADVLLAWALVESGRWEGVEDLVKMNPFPPASGPTPFASLAFPRIFDLRARIFARQGKAREAAENQRLFRLFSNPAS